MTTMMTIITIVRVMMGSEILKAPGTPPPHPYLGEKGGGNGKGGSGVPMALSNKIPDDDVQ